MAKWGSCDFKQLKKMQERMQKLEKMDLDKFCEDVTKELAARLLRKVIKRTPVGEYNDGKVGGTLRRGWTSDSHRESELSSTFGGGTGAAKYANDLPITKVGNSYQVEIINPVEYASYVEFGHRTRNHKGWVKGRFMMTISENELNSAAPKIIENKLMQYLGECFNG
jgi:hypothetical protein